MGGLAATAGPAIRSQPATHAETIRILSNIWFWTVITLMLVSRLGNEKIRIYTSVQDMAVSTGDASSRIVGKDL